MALADRVLKKHDGQACVILSCAHISKKATLARIRKADIKGRKVLAY